MPSNIDPVDLEINSSQILPENKTIISLKNDDFNLKSNVLNIHLIALGVTILIKFMEAVVPYGFITNLLALLLVFGIKNQRVKNLSAEIIGRSIEISILVGDLVIMSTMYSQNFQTRETWAVSLTLCWCFIQIMSIILNSTQSILILFQILSIIGLISNIEYSLDDPSDLRFKVYPVIILFSIAPIKCLYLYRNMQKQLFSEILTKKSEKIDNQTQFANVIEQPLLITEGQQIQFLNTSMKKWIVKILQSTPEWKRLLQNKKTTPKNIDFLHEGDFLNLKFFVKKEDYKKNESINGQSNTIFTQEQSELCYSIQDLIKLDNFCPLNLVVNSGKLDCFCLKFSENLIFNGKQCKIIQFVKITENIQRIEEKLQMESTLPLSNKSYTNQAKVGGQLVQKRSLEYNEIFQKLNMSGIACPNILEEIPEAVIEHSEAMQGTQEPEIVEVDQINISIKEEQNPKILVPISKSFNSILQIENDNYLPGVLIADDDLLNLQDLERILKKVIGPDDKYQVVTSATDGNLLVQMYQKRLDMAIESNWAIKPYSVIITDLHMPGLSGLQAIEMIQKAFFNNLDESVAFEYAPQFLVVSGDQEIINEYQKQETDYLKFAHKPLTPHQIQTMMGGKLKPLQEYQLFEQYNNNL